MGMLGNKPAAGFQSIEKQSITGNGGTTYALDHAVTNVNDLEVFVNNVRQEPTTAYTLSGQNIVMSEAIANTDSFYLIYQSRSFTKAVPADTSVTAAMLNADVQTSNDTRYVNTTGDTMTGNLGVNVSPTAALDVRRSDTDGKIAEFHQSGGYGFELSSSQSVARFRSGYLQAMSITTDPGSGAVEQMRISKEGRVTMPNQPTFSYPSSTNYSISGTGATDMTSSNVFANVAAGTSVNIGNHFNTSNGRFTAPIAGTYEFTLTGATILYSGYNYAYIRKNGGQLAYKPTNQDADWMHFSIQVYIDLAVGDYVNGHFNNNYSGGHIGHCHFSGRLVG